jgi:hypothetical protein
MRDILENQHLQARESVKKSIFKEENIVFHDLQGQDFNKSDDKRKGEEGEVDDQQRQMELEAYRRRFEEAMIRIEDQEDVEAYKDARREIDDEFDE